MFCPNCNAFLQERNLLKSNVKKWENADIEYDARCPACSEEIGRMSWGKLTVRPDLLEKQAAHQAANLESSSENTAPNTQPGGPAVPKIQGDTGKALFDPPSVQKMQQPDTHPYCPHCGSQLPDDPGQLPRH